MSVSLASVEWSAPAISRMREEKKICIVKRNKRPLHTLSTVRCELNYICTLPASSRVAQKFGLYFFTSTMR